MSYMNFPTTYMFPLERNLQMTKSENFDVCQLKICLADVFFLD